MVNRKKNPICSQKELLSASFSTNRSSWHAKGRAKVSLNILLDDNIFSGIRQTENIPIFIQVWQVLSVLRSTASSIFRYYFLCFRQGLKMNDFCPFLRSKPVILEWPTGNVHIHRSSANMWAFCALKSERFTRLAELQWSQLIDENLCFGSAVSQAKIHTGTQRKFVLCWNSGVSRSSNFKMCV